MDIIHHYEAEGLVRKISTIAGPDEVNLLFDIASFTLV
jgi:hypothetical protein